MRFARFILAIILFYVGCSPQILGVNQVDSLDGGVDMADTILTDTPGWDALNVPTPGDPIKAAVAPGAVRPGFQKLANRTAAMIRGMKNPPIILANNTPGVDDIQIAPLGWVGLVNSAGKWQVYYHAGATINATTVFGAALAANTRYYLYVYESGGVLAYEVTTTAPDAEHLYKAGGQTHAFISTFSTYGTNVAIYQQNGRNYCIAEIAAIGAGPQGNIVLDGGNAIVQTTIPLAPAVPPGAISVFLQLQLQATGAETASVGDQGTAAGYENIKLQLPGFIGNIYGNTLIATAVGNGFDYWLSVNTGKLYVWVKGFTY